MHGPVGKFGIDEVIDNGRCLLELRETSGITITNTMSKQELKHWAGWSTPKFDNYMIFDQKWRKSKLHRRAFRGCRVPTDQRLVMSKMRV